MQRPVHRSPPGEWVKTTVSVAGGQRLLEAHQVVADLAAGEERRPAAFQRKAWAPPAASGHQRQGRQPFMRPGGGAVFGQQRSSRNSSRKARPGAAPCRLQSAAAARPCALRRANAGAAGRRRGVAASRSKASSPAISSSRQRSAACSASVARAEFRSKTATASAQCRPSASACRTASGAAALRARWCRGATGWPRAGESEMSSVASRSAGSRQRLRPGPQVVGLASWVLLGARRRRHP